MDESQSEQGYTVVNMSVRMVVVAVNLVGNSLILAVVRKSQNFSLVTRHLIGHVAVADIIFGCSMVIHGFLILAGSMSYPACLGITTIAIISGLCSCWGIFLGISGQLSVSTEIKPCRQGSDSPKSSMVYRKRLDVVNTAQFGLFTRCS